MLLDGSQLLDVGLFESLELLRVNFLKLLDALVDSGLNLLL